jgi:hypothetical protein
MPTNAVSPAGTATVRRAEREDEDAVRRRHRCQDYGERETPWTVHTWERAALMGLFW